jgi:hypothetical protein
MKRISNPTIQQEVVLATNSQFARRQYCEKNEKGQENNADQEEKFMNACWNGMLKDMLPELFIQHHSDTQLFLWQMRTCKNTLTLEMAEEPREMDFSASIDPYCFMELQAYN